MRERVSAWRRTAAIAAAALLGTLALGVAASPAQAHSAAVSGTAVCDTKSGDWVVTWTVTNDFPSEVTLEKVVSAPEGAGPRNLPKTIQAAPRGGKSTATAVQYVSGESTSASLSYVATWYKSDSPDDDFTRQEQATVSFDGTCGSVQQDATKDADCVTADEVTYEYEFDGKAGTAVVRATNDLPLCEGVEQDFALASYTAPDGKFALPQYLYDTDLGTIATQTTEIALKVDLPPCFFQVDLIWGSDVIKKLTPESLYGDRALGSPNAPGNGAKAVEGKVVNTNGGDRAVFNGGDGTCEAQPAAMFADDCEAVTVTLKNTGVEAAHFVVEQEADEGEWVVVENVTVDYGKSAVVEVALDSGGKVRVLSGEKVVAEHTWELPEECVEQGEVVVEYDSDCDSLNLVLSNDLGDSAPTVEFVVSAPGVESKTIAVKPGTSAKYEVTGLKDGDVVAVAVGDEADEITYEQPEDCDTAGAPAEDTAGPELPVTGVALPAIGGLAALLLVGGVALVLVGRKRRGNQPVNQTSAE